MHRRRKQFHPCGAGSVVHYTKYYSAGSGQISGLYLHRQCICFPTRCRRNRIFCVNLRRLAVGFQSEAITSVFSERKRRIRRFGVKASASGNREFCPVAGFLRKIFHKITIGHHCRSVSGQQVHLGQISAFIITSCNIAQTVKYSCCPAASVKIHIFGIQRIVEYDRISVAILCMSVIIH